MNSKQTPSTIFDRLLDLSLIIVNCLLAVLIVIIIADVVMTYLLNAPLKWSLEISEYLLAVIAFLGAAWLLREEGHIRFDMLLVRIPPAPRALLEAAISIVGLLVSFTITCFGVKLVLDLYRRGIVMESILHLPRWALVAFVPLGMLLMSVQLCRRTSYFVRQYRALKSQS